MVLRMYNICPGCKKIFQYKSYMEKHYKNCKERVKNNRNEILEYLDLDDKIKKENENQNVLFTKNKEKKVLNSDFNNKCQYCNFFFKRKDYLKKHIDEKRCQFLKNQSQLSNHKIQNQIIFKNNQNQINPHFTQNNYFTQNIQININNFGNENLSYLKNYNFLNGIKSLGAGIVDITRRIHFNPEHPENHNIFLKNKRDNFIEVLENGIWVKKRKDDIFHSLICKAKDKFDEYFDEYFGNELDKDTEEYIKIRNSVKSHLIYKYEMDSNALGSVLVEGMNATCHFKDFQTSNDLYKRIVDDFHLLLDNFHLIKSV